VIRQFGVDRLTESGSRDACLARLVEH